jgi:Peptidase propeptide and YPEB domain
MQTVHWSRTASGIALSLLVLGSPPGWAGRKCDAPPQTWQPRSAVTALAERNGWQIDGLKVDDGCYEIKPASLQVIGIKREHGERERQRTAPPPLPSTSAPTGQLMPAPPGNLG